MTKPLPGMPQGKPSGVACVNLTQDYRCGLFGVPNRPSCCSGLQPSMEMCGENRDHAMAFLSWLETETDPDALGMSSGQ